MKKAENQSALADAERAARERPNDPAALEALGFAYFDVEQYAEAKAALERAIELNPESAPAYEKIGHIHYRIGSPPQLAIDAYERAIAIDPHFDNPYYGLGILHATKTGQYDQAIEAFKRGLTANPGDPFLTASLGTTYARMGKIEEAIAILEQVIKLHPDEAFAQDWLSLLYLHQKRFDKAIASCRRELEIGENSESHRLLGYIYDAQGLNDRAVAELERAVELAPRDYEARAALAKVYRKAGNLPAAEQHYNTALEAALQDDEYGQSCFYAVSGDVEKALTLLEIGCAKGQVQPGWVRIDPEFAFIQDEPRFQALLD